MNQDVEDIFEVMKEVVSQSNKGKLFSDVGSVYTPYVPISLTFPEEKIEYEEVYLSLLAFS